MGGYIGSAPTCYGSSLGSNPDISQEYKIGHISKGVTKHIVARKKTFKNIRLIFFIATRSGYRYFFALRVFRSISKNKLLLKGSPSLLTSSVLQARNRSPDIEVIDILDDDSSESVSSGDQENLENSTLPETQIAQIPECASPMEMSKSGDKRAGLRCESHEEEQKSRSVHPPPAEKSSQVEESSFVFPRKEASSPVFLRVEEVSPVEESSSVLPRKETSSPVFPRAGESSPVPSPVDVQKAESELLRCKECGSGQDDLRGLATHAFQHSFQLGARLMRGNNVVS
jgi:hypothetical protein